MGSIASERTFVSLLVEQGYDNAQIKDELEAMGWHPRSADRVLERYAQGEPADSDGRHPGPDLSRFPSRIEVEGREISLLASMRLPRMCLFGNFLSQEECAELIALSLPRMQRSKVIVSDGLDRQETTMTYARTSDQASFPRGSAKLVDDIRRRVALLTRWPEDHMQDLHVVRYRPGADFSPHNDYFSATAHPELARTGQRVATLLLYLNTATRGGATALLDVELDIYPQQGNALLFSYPEPRPDSLTLHAGVPLCEGEKWIATFFLTGTPVAASEPSDGEA